MAKPSQKQIDAWLKAAGKKANVSDALKQKIILAGEFIETVAKKKADDLLGGIDFSKPVKVIKSLPAGVYVQYKGKYKGHWFTQTGLTPDAVGIALGKRQRKLFKPAGGVAALESTAKSIKDTWTADRIFDKDNKRVLQLWLEKYKKKKEFLKLSQADQKKVLVDQVKKVRSKLGQMTRGGGKQFFVAKPSAMTEI